MKKMKCEICGSINIKKTADDVFECQECGIQYIKAEAIKLLTEIEMQAASISTFSAEIDNPAPANSSESWDSIFDEEDTLETAPAWSDPRLDSTAAKMIENLLLSGNKLGAIGVYREATGLGLADAKTAVEKIVKKLK